MTLFDFMTVSIKKNNKYLHWVGKNRDMALLFLSVLYHHSFTLNNLISFLLILDLFSIFLLLPNFSFIPCYYHFFSCISFFFTYIYFVTCNIGMIVFYEDGGVIKSCVHFWSIILASEIVDNS